jgi:hypothetical protein
MRLKILKLINCRYCKMGMLYVTVSEAFTFFISVTANSDRYKLIVDNLVIDKWSSNPTTPTESANNLIGMQ